MGKNKKLLALLTSLILLSGVSCAGQNQNASIQDIMTRWVSIERALIHSDTACAEYFDTFYKTLRSFIEAEVYLSRRLALAPFPHGLDGPPGIYALGALTASFREALLAGDREKAIRLSPDISGILISAVTRDGREQRFALAMHFRLLSIVAFLATLAVFAIQFMHMTLKRSIRREKEISGFSRTVLLTQEAERKRISRELHDTVVQDMRHLSDEIDAIVKIEEPSLREERYAEAVLLHSTLATRVRDICDNLAPPDFSLSGLAASLRQLCLDFSKRTGIDCRMDIAENTKADFIDREKQLQVFRIVQEALTNTEKHACATETVVTLYPSGDGGVFLNVCDNGKGFAPKPQKGGSAPLGIRGMKERAALLGGKLLIDSGPAGTSIRLNIPPPALAALPTVDVLLIDDHPLTNLGFASCFEKTGRFSVSAQASSLGEAVQFIERTHKMPQLIMLDIQLGRESGLDFLPFLFKFCQSKQIPPPPVLVCSVFEDPFRIESALKLGASGYLPKNGGREELLKAVNTVFRGEIYIPKEHAARLNGVSGKYMRLTKRELETLNLIKQNKTNQEIADTMGISIRTAETHISSLYLKTGTANRLELMGM